MFSCEIWEILRTPFLTEHLRWLFCNQPIYFAKPHYFFSFIRIELERIPSVQVVKGVLHDYITISHQARSRCK